MLDLKSRTYEPPNMLPTLAAASPSLSVMPPAPLNTLSTCPAIGAGNFSFRKFDTTLTAERAWSSEIPVFSLMRLTNSSIGRFLSWQTQGEGGTFYQIKANTSRRYPQITQIVV